jgi:hypothetical protein
MAFHETYWVITGSAAPVLGLAAVLSVGDVTRLISVHREWLGRQVLTLVDSKTLARTDVAIMRLNGRLHVLQSAQTFLVGTAIAQVVNVALQTVLLVVSLWAIISQANEGPPLLWLAVAALAWRSSLWPESSARSYEWVRICSTDGSLSSSDPRFRAARCLDPVSTPCTSEPWGGGRTP